MTADLTLTQRDIPGRVLEMWARHLADIYLNGRAATGQGPRDELLADYPSPWSDDRR